MGRPQRAVVGPHRLNRAGLTLSKIAVVAIGATFALLGMLAGAYGPLLEHLTHRFAVSLAAAGVAITVHFTGAIIGVLVSMHFTERMSGRASVTIASGSVGLGCALIALATAWPVFLLGVFVVGLGFGSLVIGLNQLVAYSEGRRRGALLNAVNAAYSAGAVASPVLVSSFARDHLSSLYAVAAVVALALISGAAGISGRLPVAPSTRGRPPAIVWIFVSAFVVYTATETGTGGWMTSHLESAGLASANAATLTSGFWLALVTGRLLITLVPESVPPPAIVLGGGALATASLLLAVDGPLAPAAYVVTGLALAPIFPTGIVWLARLRPGDARATSWLFPAAMLGGALGPGAIGLLIIPLGVAIVPVMLATLAAGTLIAFLAAARSARLAQ